MEHRREDRSSVSPAVGRSDREQGPVVCALHITTAADDDALARIVGLLRRTRWSVGELHHRGGDECHEIEVWVSKVAGRADVLLALMRREVVVIDAAVLPC